MSKLIWLYFRCTRCNKDFYDLSEGQYIYDCPRRCEDGMCFNDEDIGQVHANHVLNPLKGYRECEGCRHSMDLMSFK